MAGGLPLQDIRPAGVLLAAAAVAAFAAMQWPAAGLRRAEARSRWASNARDGLNMAGVLALFGAFAACGYSLPAAALVAGLLGLVLESVRHGARTPRGAVIVCLVVGVAVALPVAVAPPFVTGALDRLLEVLQAPA